MTYNREDSPLWIRALACTLVALAVAIASVAAVVLIAWAVRLLAGGLMWLVWLVSLVLVGGVAP